jgi:UDP-glucose 4-epimerase
LGTRGILVTGGAGYIGSHVVRQLGDAGERVVTLDDLSRGLRDAVTHGELVVGDVGDAALVRRVLAEHDVGTVMHFAAYTIVPESVAQPLRYYRNNVCATRTLLECCAAAGIGEFVFSSSAAVYGIPPDGIAAEDSPTVPINPYGTSKLVAEWMLRDLSAASALRHVALRYFNVGGSDPGGRIGQSTPQATLLTKVAAEHAVGRRPHVSIYGTDYPTPDGTGVRDYIHVADLAAAHLAALRYLRAGGASVTLNCGYGRGASVREVLAAVERVAGRPLVIREEPRRAGDPPVLVARADRIREHLGWEPRHDRLEQLVADALRWERTLLARAGGSPA